MPRVSDICPNSSYLSTKPYQILLDDKINENLQCVLYLIINKMRLEKLGFAGLPRDCASGRMLLL